MAGNLFAPTSPLRGKVLHYVLILAVLIPLSAQARTVLRITSDPPGATVEIDGMVVGKTPYQVEIPGGYVHGTKSVFGKVLRQQMRLKLTQDGYLPVQMELAKGPMPWVALNGTYHGDYWLLKSDTFSFTLQKAATTFVGNVETASYGTSPLPGKANLQTEDLVRVASPAVLQLQTSEGSGSGFLITEAGIAVTNAHVARGQGDMIANTATGQSFEAKVIYVDPTLDMALIQLQGSGFPHLSLADSASVHVGGNVVVIGSPSKGFPNSVTKGIVSAKGAMPSEPGTWIQTDAAINPGNSGGPLLSSSGEVIGITTQKQFLSNDGRPLQGIGFALSSGDVLQVIRRLSPDAVTQVQSPPELKPPGIGKISITSDTENADIYLDGKFVGNAPSVLRVPSGSHKIQVKSTSGKSCLGNHFKSGQR